MCFTDRHDMTLAVKVALNPSSSNQIKLSSANAFSLDKANMLLFEKEVKLSRKGKYRYYWILVFSPSPISICGKKRKVLDLNNFSFYKCFEMLFLKGCLTHYHTANFRLFQTERVCIRQFQI